MRLVAHRVGAYTGCMDEGIPLTAMNCSIGRSSIQEGLDSAVDQGHSNVELWWPFTVPNPTRAEMDGLVENLEARGLHLVALNMWGGDMAAGERGVLHREEMPAGHLDAVSYIHERTGVDKFNLLLGRGDDHLHTQQATRWAKVAREIHLRFGGIAMVEPLSGMQDYPIRTVGAAEALVEIAGHGGLLLDLYHVAVNAGAEQCIPEGATRNEAWRALSGNEETAQLLEDIAASAPVHVQVADAPGRSAPGTGRLPLRTWVENLRNDGYKGHVVAEWLPEPQ